MKKDKAVTKEYEAWIREAVHNLRQAEYEEAYELIIKAITVGPNDPEPQNLLGIWYECMGEKDLARKHYRMAYVLDSGFQPAGNNLQRVGTVFQYEDIPVDYGEDVLQA